MPVLSEHVDFVVEFLEQLFAYIGVEYFLYCYINVEIFTFVDCTESTHWDLLSNLQIIHADSQNSIGRFAFRLNVLSLNFILPKSSSSSSHPFILFESTCFPGIFVLLLFLNFFLLNKPTRCLWYLFRARTWFCKVITFKTTVEGILEIIFEF